MNPVKGGRPPKDSIITKIDVVIRGVLFHEWDSDRVVVDELYMNNMKVVVVIRIYRTRLSNVIVGL